MASYRNIQKVGSSHIGLAHGAEYVISGRRGNWRVTLRSNTALGVGTAAPESFYADTLQEVDARLGEIASKIAAHRAKARKARHRVDVYDGGDEPVASYPFKTEADAQWDFDRASRGADEGVEMRLFLNGKEVERHTQPEKKRRSSRRPNSGVPDGWRPSLPDGWRLFLEGSWSESARKQYVLVSPVDGRGRGKHAICVFGGQKPPHWSAITEERLREAEADRSGWLGTEIGLSAAPAAIQSEARREVREYEEERREAVRRYGNLVRLRNPNPYHGTPAPPNSLMAKGEFVGVVRVDELDRLKKSADAPLMCYVFISGQGYQVRKFKSREALHKAVTESGSVGPANEFPHYWKEMVPPVVSYRRGR